jgi:septin family protein
MVCGASGIGKTSFVELFMKRFNKKLAEKVLNSKKSKHNLSQIEFLEEQFEKFEEYCIKRSTQNFDFYEVERQDKQSKNLYRLTIIDTVGYGDSPNLNSWQTPIIDYIESQVIFSQIRIKFFYSSKTIMRDNWKYNISTEENKLCSVK